MSDSEEQDSHDFSGFIGLFNSTFNEAQVNIHNAFRDYAASQGLVEIANNQETDASFIPLPSPIGTPISSPRTDSFRSANEISRSVNNLPVYAPREENIYSGARSAPVSPSLNSRRTSVRAIRASYESLSAASSLQNINSKILPIRNKANMTPTPTAEQQSFSRDLRSYNKTKNKILGDAKDLGVALKSNKSEIEIQHLVNALEVEAEKLSEKGDKITNYAENDWAEDFKSEDWADEWDDVETKAKIGLKDGKAWLDKEQKAKAAKAAAANPKVGNHGAPGDNLYKQERLQVEQFSGNPMKWTFWKQTAEAVIQDMSEVQKRLWLKVKLTGTAKEVVGDHNIEDKTIEEIFNILEDNFGQPHMRAKQVAMDTNEMVVLDENSAMEDIETFWNKYMNLAEQCKGEKVSGENLIIMLAMLHLPPKFRERLEVKMREIKPNYKFSRMDATKPFSLVKEEMLSTYPRTNIKHIYTASPIVPTNPAATASSGASSSTPVNFGKGNSYSTPNSTSRGRGYNNFNRPNRGGGRGRGYPGQNNGYFQNPLRGPCTYCEGPHENKYCHQYNTAEKRRERLVALNRCRACMEHSSRHQAGCAPKALCKYNHQVEEKHFWHLCDGPGTIHPGSQFSQNGSQSTTGASS